MNMPKFKIAWIMGLLLSSGPVFAQQAQALKPCSTLRTFSADARLTNQVPSNSIGCRNGGRIASPQAQVFNCRGGETANGDVAANKVLLKLSDNGARILPINDFSPELNTMMLIDVNLGGGDEPEHVLAMWQAQQNGFGTNFWIVTVFDANWRIVQKFDEVEDFGARNFVQAGETCALGITKFERTAQANGVGPMFYYARFLGLDNGQLRPVSRLPARQRRYTNAFERQRLATFDRQGGAMKQGDLIAWLNGR